MFVPTTTTGYATDYSDGLPVAKLFLIIVGSFEWIDLRVGFGFWTFKFKFFVWIMYENLDLDLH